MSTMSKLLRKGEMPVELAKNFDVSESVEFYSALDCYNFQRTRWLMSGFVSVLSMLIIFVLTVSPVLIERCTLMVRLGLPSTIVFIGFCIAFSIRDREIRNFRKFDKGLENLLSVLEGSFGPPRRLHLMSYQELCEQARKVLAEHAYSIHYVKVVRGEAEDMLLGSRTRLKFMYDGLRWYGLIPKGGYHPYYAEAEKKLAAEREQEANRLEEFLATRYTLEEAMKVLGIGYDEMTNLVEKGTLRRFVEKALNGESDSYFDKVQVNELAEKRTSAPTS